MKYNMRCIGLIWIFFSVCLLACVDDTSEVAGGKSGGLEQVVLKLNVQEESLVRTRAVTEPDDTEKIGSIDFCCRTSGCARAACCGMDRNRIQDDGGYSLVFRSTYTLYGC